MKKAIERAAKPWVDAWSNFPDHDRLVRSLLKGIEHRLMQKRGEMPRNANVTGDYDWMAYFTGQECADRISEKVYSLPLR